MYGRAIPNEYQEQVVLLQHNQLNDLLNFADALAKYHFYFVLFLDGIAYNKTLYDPSNEEEPFDCSLIS